VEPPCPWGRDLTAVDCAERDPNPGALTVREFDADSQPGARCRHVFCRSENSGSPVDPVGCSEKTGSTRLRVVV